MAEMFQSDGSNDFMRLPEVSKRVRLSGSTIYDRINPKSPRYDPDFPRQYQIGARAVAWKRSEIEDWCASRNQANGAHVGGAVQTLGAKEVIPAVQITSEKKTEKKLTQPEDVEKKRISVVRELLEKHAKRGERLFYDDVMVQAMLSPNDPSDCKAIDRVLENISKAFHAEHNVLIGALVHEANTGKRRPKQAFFNLAKSLGYTYDDPDVFVEQQIIKLYELYEDPAAKSKGRLTRMRTRKNTFLVRK